MLIFDAHLDLAWNAVEWNRNLEWPVGKIREFESQFDGIVPGEAMVSFPELRNAGIGIVIATLLPRLHRKSFELTFYQGRESTYAAAKGQLAYYEAMAERGVLRKLSSADDLTEHAREWQSADQSADSASTPPIGYLLSMEGASPILSPKQVEEWFHAGLQIVGPAHYGPNEYCHGTGSEGPLTSDGVELLKEMNRVGMLLDATHLADESFWQALDVFEGPVLASHHNCRALVPGDRQLDDDQIRALIERGAVIGAALDNWMLKPEYIKKVTPPETVSLEDVVDQIDHVCQLAGNALHSGIGTDLDGGFGKEQSPGDMDSIEYLPKIAEILERRGYSQEDSERILSRNFIQFFQKNLPEKVS
ncbi:Membrane dipeptidase (Peptidase family M19) [Thalassoglobus neptunius]|uniref:Membrane dipeptidase (Peptidase family M19) n=1 Tax=Thalassoglobus neptunius TaxID=1938619 RepID=A0A5C5W7Z5_9PLAN|nr:membrane dipeptidase [Thalassoglobus neptunius]TWT47016.1 Membrane dipeptidase (Peptidase family M19) [Thalassoglobus neptunius]